MEQQGRVQDRDQVIHELPLSVVTVIYLEVRVIPHRFTDAPQTHEMGRTRPIAGMIAQITPHLLQRLQHCPAGATSLSLLM